MIRACDDRVGHRDSVLNGNRSSLDYRENNISIVDVAGADAAGRVIRAGVNTPRGRTRKRSGDSSDLPRPHARSAAETSVSPIIISPQYHSQIFTSETLRHFHVVTAELL